MADTVRFQDGARPVSSREAEIYLRDYYHSNLSPSTEPDLGMNVIILTRPYTNGSHYEVFGHKMLQG